MDSINERKLEESSRVLQYKEGESIASKEFTVYHSHHGPVIREQDGKWVSIKLMQSPIDALIQSYTRTKTTNSLSPASNMENGKFIQ